MLFNSPHFLFLFLPITLLVYHRFCASGYSRLPLFWLVAASLAFYGWWEPVYLVLLLASIVGNHCVAIGLERTADDSPKLRFWLLTSGVVANLSAIAWFKYAGFLTHTSNVWFSTDFHLQAIVLPLAISFFTFQQIAYLVDVYRRHHGAGSVLTYFLFVTFFPQLIAGPIVSYRGMAPQFEKMPAGILPTNLLLGLAIFSIGLFKKVIVADGVAPYSDTVFALAGDGGAPTLLEAWTGALAYSLQLYFDFSGYSDMALGLGCMLGVRLPINFASPYRAGSIIEFWRRWHISLSNFLRDYLYVPLGGSRRGRSRTMINLMIVMVLGGLWHGAGWTFVAWGALHGAYLLVNHQWRHWRNLSDEQLRLLSFRRFQAWPALVLYHGLTLLAIVIAWVLFRASTLAEAQRMLAGMFGFNGVALPTSWQYRHADLTSLLQQFGITFRELPTLGPVFTPLADISRLFGFGNGMDQAGTLTALLSLSVPIVVVLVLPNTADLMQRRLSPKLIWFATPVIAVMAAYSAFGGSGTAQFLYFNF